MGARPEAKPVRGKAGRSPSHGEGSKTLGISRAGEAWPQNDPCGNLGIEAAGQSKGGSELS